MNLQNKIKMLDFAFYKYAGGDFFGIYKNTFHGSGLEFSELTQYQYGDTLKHIDWNTSAKKGKMYAKKFHEERNMKVLFVMDVSETMDFGSEKRTKNDIQEELFYTLSLSALHNGESIGAFLYHDTAHSFISFSNGFENVIRILQQKEDLKNNQISSQNQIQPFESLMNMHLKDTLIFVLSDKIEVENDCFKSLTRFNHLIYINIFDYFENFLSSECVGISLKENEKVVDIVTLNNTKKLQYIALRKEKIENFKQNLLKNGIMYLYIDTKTPIFEQLFLFFAKLKY